MVYYTKEGLESLKDSLKLLKSEGRAKIASELAEARSKGDLSENAEYDAAKEAQNILEAKIAALETILSHAIVLDNKDVDISRVSILSKVRIHNKKTNQISVFMIVSQEEADLKLGRISVDSPMGKGLLGKRVGDTAIIETPSGQIALEILEIGLNL